MKHLSLNIRYCNDCPYIQREINMFDHLVFTCGKSLEQVAFVPWGGNIPRNITIPKLCTLKDIKE